MRRFFTLMLVTLVLAGCYTGSGNGARNEYVYYPEANSNILFIHPAKDERVNGSAVFSTLDSKVPFELITYFGHGDDPRISIKIGFGGYQRGTEKIELDCSRAALILNGRRFAHKVGGNAEKEIQRAKVSQEAWHLECIKEIALYDTSGVYVYNAELLFWPGERLGESFSIELPTVKNDPQMSKPLVVKFVRELRVIRPGGGV